MRPLAASSHGFQVAGLLAIAALTSSSALAQADQTVRARAFENYGKLPLSFEANQGQMDRRAKFVSRGPGYTLFLTGNEAVLSLKAADQALRMQLLGVNRDASIAGNDELPGKSNYFIGQDPAQWHTNISNYSKVRYSGIYPGVDLVYYGNQRQLEYDFVVAPGADPGSIRLGFQGARRIRVEAKSGDLILQMKSGGGEVRFHRPVIYQERNSQSTSRTLVDGRFVVHASKMEVGFEVAAYDRGRPLIIDPVLVYSTYLGGSGNDRGYAIAVDALGNAYVTGQAGSSNFPTTRGAYQTAKLGVSDVFVTKLNPTGTALLYSTYLGGASTDIGFSIAVDASGNAYVTGITGSSNFPTTAGAYRTTVVGNNDVFVTKLNATGAGLLYSTYLGGSGYDQGIGIAVDASGNAYVTGSTASSNFPTTPGAYQTALGGGLDAFVTTLNATGTGLLYSTYLGGSLNDQGFGIAVDASGNAYVTGSTESSNFPTTPGAYQTANGGDLDAFVTKLNATGAALYSTYLGGSLNDQGVGIAVDASGNVYVAGSANSTNFPTTPGAYQTANRGAYDATVTKLNAGGTALLYSTYLGGSVNDQAYGIAVDASGNAYVTGYTNSSNFPTTPGAYQTANHGFGDAIVTQLSATGAALLYSTYLGGSFDDQGFGIAVDASGNAFVTGSAPSRNFPTTRGAYQTANRGGDHAFVTRFGLAPTTLSFTAASATSSDFDDATQVQASLTITGGIPVPNETVTFMLGSGAGTPTCSAVTDANGTATCLITPNQAAGPVTLTATFAGNAAFEASSASATFTVTNEEAVTKFTATSPTLLANGSSATFSATLQEDGVTPISGGTLTFTLGSGAGAQSCSGATDDSGTASCSIAVNQPLGPNTVKAVFASDGFYVTSSDTEPVLVFAFLGGGGSFVIGNLNGVAGNAVEFWGAQWAQYNSLGGGSAPNDFKGFASTAATGCGGMWTTGPGNSSDPPASVPSYMAVIASSSIGKSGPRISGDIAKIVIVKTDAGYQADPGHAGTGTVVAVLCSR